MVSKAQMLAAMQYSSFIDKNPMNETGHARYQITFQFAGTSRPADLPTSSYYSGWTPFSAAEKTATRSVLTYIETLLNVDFVEVAGSGDPDMNFGKVALDNGTAGRGGYSMSYSGSNILNWDGYAVFDNDLDLSQPAQVDLLLHEIGHALGLKHPFSDAHTLPRAEDNNKFTVMSYDPNPDNGQDSDAMMLYDIYALQDIWGAAANRTGNSVYTGARTSTVDSVWDSGGIDTFDASARSKSVLLDLREGGFSTFGNYPDVVIAYGTRIENAKGGSGDDKLIGNGWHNRLTGGAGEDTLLGGSGKDKLLGGSGKDMMNGQTGYDKLWGGWGNDRLLGGWGNDRLYGQKHNDTLKGGSGNDILKGGKGNDTLLGEAGNDILVGHSGADKFVFAKNGGNDRILDFKDDVDHLRFDGLGKKASILAKASEIGQDVVFDFGAGGQLTVHDITIADLRDDILV